MAMKEKEYPTVKEVLIEYFKEDICMTEVFPKNQLDKIKGRE